MTLQARVIGPESDLGHIQTLDYFGNTISREFSDVKLTPAQALKAEGNPYIEIKGTAPAAGADDDAVEADLIRERLAELGVEVSPKAGLPTLRTKLDTAEKAEAKRLEDEADAAEKARQEAEQSQG